MSNIETLNLDRLAALKGQQVVQELLNKHKKAGEIDNTVTKALGVLQENGVYACFLYLLAKEKEEGLITAFIMLELLEELNFTNIKSHQKEQILKNVAEKVTVNLERLLLAKETLEKMLIYARYGAKACGKE